MWISGVNYPCQFSVGLFWEARDLIQMAQSGLDFNSFQA
jgi:hypothetical protein